MESRVLSLRSGLDPPLWSGSPSPPNLGTGQRLKSLISGKLANLSRGSPQLGTLVGLAMLVAASVVFLYYSLWTMVMVSPVPSHPFSHPPFPSSLPTP